ncbi:threonine ammonia-lyase [Haloarcula sp. CBA1130]|uniref:threonine ammonia-lyase n=1 Tax=unclassified Haloarcula TaxID=2624677 RepID=UPI001245D1B4|nr:MULTISPECIES: threonine ammonia-lyase [unclassified Haloarcula]KAA9395901.1 threonine ammonia-lyase [Haloarcula sp. CBA1129]KAA9400170.1 threonine ammonia-lyase [Haloarcula sp. CBA1130]
MTQTESDTLPVTYADIERARERLDDDTVVKKTPVERSTSLGGFVDAEVHLKMEHLQWTGSFKTRGAYNKISQDVADGVESFVAASAGNHAQGVALAATKCGADSTIFMPENAPQAKIDATRGYGGSVELVGNDFQETMSHAKAIVEETDAEFVHAYDDLDIIAGQGTLGTEMYHDCPDVDTVVVPIGGGGLISGVSTAIKHLSPETRVVGVQATGAETVHESLDKGIPVVLDEVDTIADGIATGGISETTLDIIEANVDEVVTVTDTDIAQAILLLMERAKQVVEGAGAASVAAILSDDLDVSGETVMPLLCGGNLDMTQMREVLIHALTERQQLLQLRVRIDDQPGVMEEISGVIARQGANIHDVRHERSVENLEIGEAYLVFNVETSGAEHAGAIITAIRDAGYPVDNVARKAQNETL